MSEEKEPVALPSRKEKKEGRKEAKISADPRPTQKRKTAFFWALKTGRKGRKRREKRAMTLKPGSLGKSLQEREKKGNRTSPQEKEKGGERQEPSNPPIAERKRVSLKRRGKRGKASFLLLEEEKKKRQLRQSLCKSPGERGSLADNGEKKKKGKKRRKRGKKKRK